MEEDDGLLLNLAGTDSAANEDARKKQRRELQPPKKQQPSKAAASALKGYSLDAALDEEPQQHAPPGPPLPQKPSETSIRGRNTQTAQPEVHEAQAEARRLQANRRESRPAEPRPAEQTVPEVIEEPEHKEASEDEDVMEAVARSRRRDAGLEALLQRRQSNHEAGPSNSDAEEEEERKVVTFIDERKKMRIPQRAKPRQTEEPKQKKATFKGTANDMKTGELTHRGQAAVDNENFEPVKADTFEGLGLPKSLADHLEELNFMSPTRIQQQAIPRLLRRRDALVNAPTGSGKTLAYLAPIMADLQAQTPHVSRAEGTYALILVPTRELCLQVSDILTLLVRRYIWLVGGSIHGGENRAKEKARLRKGVTVLVATPGRLLDHLQNTQAFRTEELRWLVLDEADRLLDLGFEQKIGEIISMLDKRVAEAGNRKRQTVLLSATLHSRLSTLASLSLKEFDPIGFRVQGSGAALTIENQREQADGSEDDEDDAPTLEASDREQFSIPKLLKQHIVEVPCKQRLVVLAALLRKSCQPGRPAKLVVFFSCCDAVEYLHRLFDDIFESIEGERLVSCPLYKLHGNLPQGVRTNTFLEFSRCKRGVLMCTDVAARGLDFPEVTTIIQYDAPGEAAEYVHRVGRTARMGKVGEAMLFLMPSERAYLGNLEARGVQLRPLNVLPALDVLPPDTTQQGWNGRSLETHGGAHALQGHFMEAVARDRSLQSLATDAFRSSVRAYAAYPVAVKNIFHVKKLHIGHVAHSFALREAPSTFGRSAHKEERNRQKREAHAGKSGKRSRQN
ncbi:g1390 [Coccomyxa viridis]|uniref:ATP-dependent RNA helicase n=1 Tax=Coccomyxa viridis TaxID=1274662 RepID=A0ABP1FK15_9CHLO